MTSNEEPLDLAAIRARVDAATEGPWEVEYDNADDYEAGISDGDYPYALRGPANITAQSPTVTDSWRENYGHRVNEMSELLSPDAEFIAHARTDVPALLDALTTAQADLAARGAEPTGEALEKAAAAAFFSDDIGGHIKGKWTWETISEDGRDNYRNLVRVIAAELRTTPTTENQEQKS